MAHRKVSIAILTSLLVQVSVCVIADEQQAVGEKAEAAQRQLQITEWARLFTEQGRPMLLEELAFIRQVCELPTKARPKIKAAGEVSLKKVAHAMSEQRLQPDGGMPSRPNPRHIIQSELAIALKDVLTPEGMAGYAKECAARNGDRKRVVILAVISQLDDTLSLSKEQRSKICESISSNWRDNWEQWLVFARSYRNQYFPRVPDTLLVSHLNDEQKSVWDNLVKTDGVFWGGIAGDQIQDNDGWWDEEAGPAGEKAEAAVLVPPIEEGN